MIFQIFFNFPEAIGDPMRIFSLTSNLNRIVFLALFIAITSTVLSDYKGVHETRTNVNSCQLGFSEFKGNYQTDKKILLSEKPVKEYEFMATGTGVTGLAVRVPDQLVMQINHADSFDGFSQLRMLGRLKLDMDGYPFANPKEFEMIHDLRRSLILIQADQVEIEIRANIETDSIRIDVFDKRQKPTNLRLIVEQDMSYDFELLKANQGLWYHQNPITLDKLPEYPVASGRTFGLAVTVNDPNNSTWKSGRLFANSSKHHVIVIQALSEASKAIFDTKISKRLSDIPYVISQEYIDSHEKLWLDFWKRSYFEPDDSNGQFTKFQAAFDLSRYYIVCSSGIERDWPVHFQNDLFRYTNKYNPWSEFFIIMGAEQYQALYPAMRTGDLSALKSHFQFIGKHLSTFTPEDNSEIAFIPYAFRGTVPGKTKSDTHFSLSGGDFSLLMLMADYVMISNDEKFMKEVFIPFAGRITNLVRTVYTEKDENGDLILFPSTSGETWDGVVNSSELVSGLRAFLSQAIIISQKQGWAEEEKNWKELLDIIPSVPRGTLVYEFNKDTGRPRIDASDLFAPASDMSKVNPRKVPWYNFEPYHFNRQQTNLYAIWPFKQVTRNPEDIEDAIMTYKTGHHPHLQTGWAADIAQAATLGMLDEVMEWFDKHFDWTYNFPNGLATEEAPRYPGLKLGLAPSMQGMGTGASPVFEMLMQDYSDELKLLPCWPKEISVRFQLYSPFAGKVTVDYDAQKGIVHYTTDKPVEVTLPNSIQTIQR